MTTHEGHQEIASRWQHFPAGLEAAAKSFQRREDIRYDGIKRWLHKIIEQWQKVFSTQQGGEFRTDESVLEQHFLASLPRDDWRVPYGVDGYAGWQMMREIERRRKHGISLDVLAWPRSDDPYAPSNNPNHPLHIEGR